MQQLQPRSQRFWIVLHVQDWRGANAHMLIPNVEGAGFGQQLSRIPNRSSDRAGGEAQGFGMLIHDPGQVLTGRAFFNVQALDHFFTSGTN